MISVALRSYRMRNGLSQEKAAFRCGISVRTFGNLEREGNHEINTLQKVVDGLGMTHEDFFYIPLVASTEESSGGLEA